MLTEACIGALLSELSGLAGVGRFAGSTLGYGSGWVVTQVIMAAVLIATAATAGQARQDAPLDTVQRIVQAVTPFLGERSGKLLFALGMTGSALVAMSLFC